MEKEAESAMGSEKATVWELESEKAREWAMGLVPVSEPGSEKAMVMESAMVMEPEKVVMRGMAKDWGRGMALGN